MTYSFNEHPWDTLFISKLCACLHGTYILVEKTGIKKQVPLCQAVLSSMKQHHRVRG